MQIKLKCTPVKVNGLRLRGEPRSSRRRLALVASCIFLAAGLAGCHPKAEQPAESDQVQFSAMYMSNAERLLNQGFSDRDSATQALAQTIENYREGAFRTQAPAWQPHVSIETLPDGARRIAILLKQPAAYTKSEVFHLAAGVATQGEPRPLTR